MSTAVLRFAVLWKWTNLFSLTRSEQWPLTTAVCTHSYLTGPCSSVQLSYLPWPRGRRRGGRPERPGWRPRSPWWGPWHVSQPVTCPPHVTCYLWVTHVYLTAPLCHMWGCVEARPSLNTDWRVEDTGPLRPGLRERESWSSQPGPCTEALCPVATRAGLQLTQ